MLKNEEDIQAWLDKYEIDDYTINADMTVDVDGHVDLCQKNLTSIPIKFGVVAGLFDCSTNALTSLKSCPSVVGGDFLCYSNKLTNLVGGPQYVGRDYNCENNPLNSIEGCPINVGRDINFNNTTLTEISELHSKFNGLFYHSGTPIKNLENYYSLNQYQQLSCEINHSDLKSILFYHKLNIKIAITNQKNTKTNKLKL